MFTRLKGMTYSAMPFIGIMVDFIGTFLHELAHFTMALLLNGQPVSFSLIPRRSESGWTLGKVASQNITWYNAIPIAMAPLFLLILAFNLEIWFGQYFNQFTFLLALVVIVENAIPSIQDFRVALSNIVGIAFYSFCVFLIFVNLPAIHILISSLIKT